MRHGKDMPVARDVSVHASAGDPGQVPDETAHELKSGLVTVMGFDKNDVLFRSSKVGTVQWRDSSGKIIALLVRLKPDIWGFSKNGDDDWNEVLNIHGNPDC